MAAAFNKVILIGNFTKDPELQYTPQGTAVTDFRLAINEKFKDKSTTTFIDVVAWNKTAENICAYMHKGSSILVEGRLFVETWDDRESGKKKSRTKVVAGQCQFLGSAKSNDSGNGSSREQQCQSRTPEPDLNYNNTSEDDMGDVPF